MRHPLLPVLLHHIVHHILPPVFVEIDVDIRQRDSLRVQETLEQQVVRNRVYIRDFQTVSHHRPRRRTPTGPHGNPDLPRRPDKVPHDQKIARKPHPLNGLQLEIDALPNLVGQFFARIPPLGPLPNDMPQIQVLSCRQKQLRHLPIHRPDLLFRPAAVHPLLHGLKLLRPVLVDLPQPHRYRLLERLQLHHELVRQQEVGHVRLVAQRILLDLVHNLLCRRQGLQVVRKQSRHLVITLQVLLSGITHPQRVVQIPSGTQADQPVVRLGILRQDIMHVVRRNILDSVLLSQLQQRLIDRHLMVVHLGIPLRIARPVSLQLEVIVLPEQIPEPPHRLVRPGQIPPHDALRNLAPQTRRTANDPLMILRQQLLVDPRVIIEPLGPSIRHEFNEIVIPRQILGQQNQVMPPAVLLVRLVEPAPRRHIDLAPENRFDPGRMSGIVKLLHTEHIPVIGNGQRGHPQLLGPGQELLDRGRSIQNGVLRMYV